MTQSSRGSFLVRTSADRLAEPNGQLYFDFFEEEAAILGFAAASLSAREWFERGCEHEAAGQLPEAAEAYRQALLAGGPDPVTCFNLANVLYRLGEIAQAIERYSQAVELDRDFGEAWNNLGMTLAESGRREQATGAFRKAITCGHTDAHYNLASLLDELGRQEDAGSHWRRYLHSDAKSPWSQYARQRLDSSKAMPRDR